MAPAGVDAIQGALELTFAEQQDRQPPPMTWRR
jgi:hypothetical protein